MTGAGIRFTERVVVVGQTGRGKSELSKHLLAGLAPRKVILDPKDEVSYPGAVLARGRGLAAALEADHAAVRWVPATGTPNEWGEAFRLLHERREPLVALLDEGYSPGMGNANRAPGELRLYVTQGRSRGHGLITATQRPFNVARELLTEAQHFFLFGPPLHPDDMGALAPYVGRSEPELRRLVEQLPPYAFLWRDRVADRLVLCDPLPDHLRVSARRPGPAAAAADAAAGGEPAPPGPMGGHPDRTAPAAV